MNRDIVHSGEIFEPKTVQTSFQINCDSIYACLFAIELKTKQIVWLNMALNNNSNVAGNADLQLLHDYFDICKIMNLQKFFTMLASEVVVNPEEADVVVSDKQYNIKEGAEVINSWSIDRILALLNEKE